MPYQQESTQTDRTPLITFIIPVYNIPVSMLHECIESILALSLHPSEREIILVDDGSDNSPIGDLKELSQQLIYIRTANNGVSEARNTGLRMAQGEFVQFIDGDDLLLTSTYEHVLRLAQTKNCDMVMFDFSETAQADNNYKDSPCVSGTELMHRNNIHGATWGYLFRRSLLGTLRFTPGVAYGEDEEFTAQLLLRAEYVRHTTAKAYYYRERNTSAIHAEGADKHLQRLDDNKQVIFRLSGQLDSLPADDRNALERRVAQLTMDYIYNTIRLTRDRQCLNQRIEELRSKGLFPLPDRDYTTKYKWFRRMTNSEIGRRMLMRLLPMMEKER